MKYSNLDNRSHAALGELTYDWMCVSCTQVLAELWVLGNGHRVTPARRTKKLHDPKHERERPLGNMWN
jgi:hypothetical protein